MTSISKYIQKKTQILANAVLFKKLTLTFFIGLINNNYHKLKHG